MTPVEELCSRLDERGVEWNTYSVSNTEYVHWTNGDGHWCAASIGGPSSLHVNILGATPEQAIAATVGEECEMRICKRCGVAYELNIIDKGFGKHRFCPNCGYREMRQ